MRLELNSLQVESFVTASDDDIAEPVPVPDTGPGGPESYCYICYETGNTDPACQPQKDTIYYPCPLPDTYFHPCTRNPTPCVNCA
jgi:hypothetical protein